MVVQLLECSSPREGSTFYRLAPGPAGAPTVVLLHGWTSTADITWHGAYARLAERFTVIAPDLRGHGHGPRGQSGARLTDVASDVVGLMESLHLGPSILIGYSLGGAAAQIVGRRRPDLLLGLVVCASACRMCSSLRGSFASALLKTGSRLAAAIPEAPLRFLADGTMRALFGDSDFERWARARTSSHNWSDVLSLGADVMSFDSRSWIEELDVPAAVVITDADRFVPPHRQRLLARSLAATEVCIEGDHSVCLARPSAFADALLRACESVIPAPSSGGALEAAG